MCENHPTNRYQIAKSNMVTISRCGCGQYWLTFDDGDRPSTITEQAMCEIIESLARLKLPGALVTTR